MDAKTYQREAARTAAPIDFVAATCDKDAQRQIRLLLSVIGISGEAIEVQEVVLNQPHPDYSFDVVKFSKELGDVYWYNAHAADTLEFELESVTPTHGDILTHRTWLAADMNARTIPEIVPILVVQAGKLSEYVKKVVFHKHALDIDRFFGLQTSLLSTLGVLCYLLGTNPGTVMGENIAKLRARYPEKFETQLSENKDERNE